MTSNMAELACGMGGWLRFALDSAIITKVEHDRYADRIWAGLYVASRSQADMQQADNPLHNLIEAVRSSLRETSHNKASHVAMRGGGVPAGVSADVDGKRVNEHEVWNWERRCDGSLAGRGTCIGWLNPNKHDDGGRPVVCIDADALLRAAKSVRPDAVPYGREQMVTMMFNAGLLLETDDKRRSKFVQVRGLSARGRGLESILVVSQNLLLDGLPETPMTLPLPPPSPDISAETSSIRAPAANADQAAIGGADQTLSVGQIRTLKQRLLMTLINNQRLAPEVAQRQVDRMYDSTPA
jgi:hypothetical protein